MADDPCATAAARCDCGHGLLLPPLHHDNCPVLLAWLMQSVPEGEAEIVAADELRTLDDI